MNESKQVFVCLVPTAPPQNVVVQSSTATQLDVTWDPPPLDAQNGDIQGYKVSTLYQFELNLQPVSHYVNLYKNFRQILPSVFLLFVCV